MSSSVSFFVVFQSQRSKTAEKFACTNQGGAAVHSGARAWPAGNTCHGRGLDRGGGQRAGKGGVGKAGFARGRQIATPWIWRIFRRYVALKQILCVGLLKFRPTSRQCIRGSTTQFNCLFSSPLTKSSNFFYLLEFNAGVFILGRMQCSFRTFGLHTAYFFVQKRQYKAKSLSGNNGKPHGPNAHGIKTASRICPLRLAMGTPLFSTWVPFQLRNFALYFVPCISRPGLQISRRSVHWFPRMKKSGRFLSQSYYYHEAYSQSLKDFIFGPFIVHNITLQ